MMEDYSNKKIRLQQMGYLDELGAETKNDAHVE
jgi:hypothetical protein